MLVMATMHGEEDFGQYVAYRLLEGRKIRDVDLWVLPVANPDGLAHDRRWVSGHVDLNRNLPHAWVKRANSGPKAVSEQETKVIMDFLRYSHIFAGVAVTVEYGSKARSTTRMKTTDAAAVLAAVGGRRG